MVYMSNGGAMVVRTENIERPKTECHIFLETETLLFLFVVFFFRFLLLLFVCLFVYLFVCLFCFVFSCYLVLCIRPFQILLGNFLATFRILSNFFVREQLQATFRKTSTFLVTIGLFWTKMLNNLPFLNKLVKKKIPLVKVLNIFLVKLIFLPFEWVSCGCGN